MCATFTDSDEGKDVVNSNGETVGIIAEVNDGTAHVDPDPDITDNIKSQLGWGDAGADTYALQQASVSEITDDEIRLNRP